MKRFFSFINWSTIGKVATIIAIFAGATAIYKNLSDFFGNTFDIEASIDINEYSTPKIFIDYIDSTNFLKMFKKLKNPIDTNYFANKILAEKLINDIDSITNKRIKQIPIYKFGFNLDLNDNKIKFDTSFLNLLFNILKMDNLDDFKYGEKMFAIIKLKNSGKKEILKVNIETKSKGFYEMKKYEKTIKSEVYTDAIYISSIEPQEELKILVWTNKFVNFKIWHSEGIIEFDKPEKISGFYAWASKNFNSWFDFYFKIILLLYIIYLIIQYVPFIRGIKSIENKVKDISSNKEKKRKNNEN